MKLIIDIDKETYKKCKWKNNGVVGLEWWERAIANGTVLEPHGRLIDADAQNLQAELWTFTRYTGIDEMPYEDATQAINNAPTILEAWGNEE